MRHGDFERKPNKNSLVTQGRSRRVNIPNVGLSAKKSFARATTQKTKVVHIKAICKLFHPKESDACLLLHYMRKNFKNERSRTTTHKTASNI